MYSTLLVSVIALIMVPMINTQPQPQQNEQCDCENDYGKDFCPDQINPANCYVNENKKEDGLKPKGVHCAKSCKTCCYLPRFQCKDKPGQLNCSTIKAYNLCGTKDLALSAIIKEECGRTCGLCGQACADIFPGACKMLASSCYDDDTKKLCPKTCKVCETPKICFDTIQYCSALKGSCNDQMLKPMMDAACNQTCGLCSGAQPTASSTVQPCTDQDSRCSVWANNGFCTNPFYTSIVRRCARSCNLCS